MKTVIQAKGLGKQYHRGLRVDGGLRHVLDRLVRSPLSFFRPSPGELFWALRDVDLEVGQGEVLGLVGRNGAGKTTLLKILSRITRPTRGWAEIRGHVRSLLEVGTGFHGELTGRENTYFSGSMLGMKKREIDRKLDEIVSFAEIEKFIDTPVKHYSSGMYVRLAFAVAAHLEPEILLVDEVLAVGDLNFQKKCLGKMDDVVREGRTILLVSHQMNQMRRLCQRCIWIDAGQLRLAGPTLEVISAYELAMSGNEKADKNKRFTEAIGKGRFLKWEIAENCEHRHVLTNFQPVTIKFSVAIAQPLARAIHGIALYNVDRQLVWGWASGERELEVGAHEFCHKFPMLPLRPGVYSWLVSLYDENEEIDAWECLPELIIATPDHQHKLDHWQGLLNVPNEFSVLRTSGLS